jgi:hypothetical protein
MKPAITVVDMLAGKLMLLQSFRPTAVTRSAPRGNPRMNAKRHDLPAESLGGMAFRAMPDTPTMRPIVSIRMIAAMPMRAPPTRPETGAKFVMVLPK